MSALNIPGIGERTGERYIRTVDFGFTGETGVDVEIAATGDVALININEPNVFVHSLDKQVVAVLNAAATFTINIGDGADSDGYWTDTLFLSTTCDAVFANAGTTVAYAAGKLYTTTDVINVNNAGSALTAGHVKLRIEYSRGVDTDLAPATAS
jgi:hypothetical protein